MQAMNGTVIIKPMSARKESEGGIVIPKIARRTKNSIGKVVAISPYPAGSRARIWSNGKRKWHIPSKLECQELAGLNGQYILVDEGVQFVGADKEVYVRARVEHIIATVDEPASAELIGGSVARCPRCKSSGESNLLLDDKGYCPRCGMNAAGDRRRDRQDSVSEELAEFMAGRDARDKIRRRKGLAERERITSYAGQTHHSRLKA